MNTKRELLENPNSVLNRADMDEPLFVLRGTDPLAPDVIDDWIHRLLSHGGAQYAEKANKASNVATEFRVWQLQNVARVKVPS